MSDKILLDKKYDEKVAVITINRPEKRNAFDADILNGYIDALDEVRDDDGIQVVLTQANGPSFAAGMDLHYLRDFRASFKPVYDWGRMKAPARLSLALINYPKISVAAVHGYCLGGGFSLMMAHDVVIVADDAQIGMPEVLRGSFGQGVTAQVIKEGIPRKKAVLLQLLGRNLSGLEAERLGLATFSVPAGEVKDEALKIATELGTRNPSVLAHAKIAINLDQHLPLEHAMWSDDMVAARMRVSIDPLGDVEGYLKSQKGGTNKDYQRN
ncbi:enoyl-CoA hydratase/isomerase family protein [Streptomyces sp. NPDC001315]|uniref:enoyl-CoA hydratase/isomerase family protein n=1 Tax=Streptomyces sp. NPDC001315 TaxID=3364562 RepID=UPI00367BCA0B